MANISLIRATANPQSEIWGSLVEVEAASHRAKELVSQLLELIMDSQVILNWGILIVFP